MKVNNTSSKPAYSQAEALQNLPKVSIGTFINFKVTQFFIALGSDDAKINLKTIIENHKSAINAWLTQSMPDLDDIMRNRIMGTYGLGSLINDLEPITQRHVEVLYQNKTTLEKHGISTKDFGKHFHEEEETVAKYLSGMKALSEEKLDLASVRTSVDQKFLLEIHSHLPFSSPTIENFTQFDDYAKGLTELPPQTKDKLASFIDSFSKDQESFMQSLTKAQQEDFKGKVFNKIESLFKNDSISQDQFKTHLASASTEAKNKLADALLVSISKTKRTLRLSIRDDFNDAIQKKLPAQSKTIQGKFKSFFDAADIESRAKTAKESVNINDLIKIESELSFKTKAADALSSDTPFFTLDISDEILKKLEDLMEKSPSMDRGDIHTEVQQLYNKEVRKQKQSSK